MKKLLAILCAIVLLIPCFSAYATNQSYEVEMLTELGIIQGYEDGNFHGELPVTRAHMAAMLIRALGYNLDNTKIATSFKDVPENHWASGYIAFAQSKGIINGYSSDYFGPNDNVTHDQAISMAIRALGYQDAYLSGEWPLNAIYQALSLGILDNFNTGSQNASREEIVSLICSSLNVPFVSYNILLNSLVETESTMLKSLKVTSENQIIYDDFDLLGVYATIYSKNDKIISIKPISQSYEYDEDLLLSKYSNVDLIYNSKIENRQTLTSDEIEDWANGASVTVNGTLKNNKFNEIYSIVKWEANSIEEFDDKIPYTLDENCIFVNFTSEEDIVNGEFVTYYFLPNTTTVIKAEIADSLIQGQVTKTSVNSQNEISYYINGIAYTSKAPLDVGNTYKCQIDNNNTICYAKKLKTTIDHYGVYMGKSDNNYHLIQTADGLEAYLIKNCTIPSCGDLIMFNLNSNGAINKITESFTSDTVIFNKIAVELDNNEKHYANRNCTVFNYDNENAECFIGNLASVKNKENLGKFAYFLDENGRIAYALVDAENALISLDDTYGLITNTSILPDSNYAISGWINGKKVSEITTLNYIAPSTSLYKISYHGSTINNATKIEPNIVFEVAERLSDCVYFNETYEAYLSQDAIVYHALDNEYEITEDLIPIGATISCYELNGEDGYDIIIWYK